MAPPRSEKDLIVYLGLMVGTEEGRSNHFKKSGVVLYLNRSYYKLKNDKHVSPQLGTIFTR